MDNYEVIHKPGYPIGILLEFDIIGRVLSESRSAEELKRAREEAIEQYDNKRSEEQRDLDEIKSWVMFRLREALEAGYSGNTCKRHSYVLYPIAGHYRDAG